MTRINLPKGTPVIIDGVSALVDCRSFEPKGFWVMPVDGPTTPFIVSDIEIPRRIVDGTFKIQRTKKHGGSAEVAALLDQSIAKAKPRDADTMAFRMTFVKALEKVGLHRFRGAGRLRDLAAAAVADVPVPEGRKRPSGATVVRWWSRYRHVGHRSGTIPLHALKGTYGSRKPDFVVDVVEEAIDRHYGGHGTAQRVVERAIEYGRQRAPTDLDRYVEDRVDEDGVVESVSIVPRLADGSIDWDDLVSESYVRARVRARTAMDRAVMVRGPEAATWFAAYGEGPVVQNALQHSEIDSFCLSKVFIVDDRKRLPLGYPWVTALVDSASRAVLGLAIGFMPPRGDTIAECLAHAVMPKDLSWAGLDPDTGKPIIEGDWAPFGTPSTVGCDQGTDCVSAQTRDGCFRLGMHLDVLPPGSPQLKGKIERFIGTVKRGQIGELLGILPSQIAKGKSGAGADYLLTLDELRLLLTFWIVEIYHRRRHHGIGRSPQQAWDELNELAPVEPPPAAEDLTLILGCYAECVADGQGVRLLGLKYNSSELKALRKEVGREKGKIRGVTVKYDPADIGSVMVMTEDPRKPGETLAAPAYCTQPRYARGLTLHQHHVIKAYAKSKAPKGKIMLDQLMRARLQLNAIADRMMAERKSTKAPVRVARYLGTDLRHLEDFREAYDEEESRKRIEFLNEEIEDGMAENQEAEDGRPEKGASKARKQRRRPPGDPDEGMPAAPAPEGPRRDGGGGAEAVVEEPVGTRAVRAARELPRRKLVALDD